MTAQQVVTAVLSGGLIGGGISYYQTNRLRRKQIVAEAFETALARVEVLYKIRRRTTDKRLLSEDELDIRNEMHEVQKKTDYYIGILNAESAWLGASYERLVDDIKTATDGLFREAWKGKPKGAGAELMSAKHPQLKDARKRFTKDTRRYFNPIKRVFFGSLYRISALWGSDE